MNSTATMDQQWHQFKARMASQRLVTNNSVVILNDEYASMVYKHPEEEPSPTTTRRSSISPRLASFVNGRSFRKENTGDSQPLGSFLSTSPPAALLSDQQGLTGYTQNEGNKSMTWRQIAPIRKLSDVTNAGCPSVRRSAFDHNNDVQRSHRRHISLPCQPLTMKDSEDDEEKSHRINVSLPSHAMKYNKQGIKRSRRRGISLSTMLNLSNHTATTDNDRTHTGQKHLPPNYGTQYSEQGDKRNHHRSVSLSTLLHTLDVTTHDERAEQERDSPPSLPMKYNEQGEKISHGRKVSLSTMMSTGDAATNTRHVAGLSHDMNCNEQGDKRRSHRRQVSLSTMLNSSDAANRDVSPCRNNTAAQQEEAPDNERTPLLKQLSMLKFTDTTIDDEGPDYMDRNLVLMVRRGSDPMADSWQPHNKRRTTSFINSLSRSTSQIKQKNGYQILQRRRKRRSFSLDA